MLNLKNTLIKVDYWLKQSILHLLQKIFFKKFDKTKAINIIIFRTGSMGDSICSIPAIYTIRQNLPHAHITVVYNAGGKNLASIEHLIDNNLVDEFFNYAGVPLKEVYKTLKTKLYDTYIEFPQVHQPFTSYLRNILFARAIRVKYGMGWEIVATRLFPKIQEQKHTFTSVREFFMSILSDAGFDIPQQEVYPLNITTNDQQLIEKLLPDYPKHSLVAVVPGAKRPQNRWPVHYFDEVITYLLQQKSTIVLIGGSEDTALAKKLSNYKACIDFTGKLTPVQSAVILKKCAFTVTNDTGPMHLAYAAESFVFALFSSRDYPNLWYPPKNKSVVFRNNAIHCSACFTESCPTNICMQQIKPKQVIQEIKKKYFL